MFKKKKLKNNYIHESDKLLKYVETGITIIYNRRRPLMNKHMQLQEFI